MEIISIPVKEYTEMKSPYLDGIGPSKVRFYVRLSDVPASIANWMSTNPREQNLNSPVAQAIMSSIQSDSRNFHLKNRGILLSAKSAMFVPSKDGASDGRVDLVLEQERLHGNVDGGHTLKLILESQLEKNLPEQYVEFEVMVGLDDLLPIAEARNTSVALDMRTMEEMKGSFEVLKSIFDGVEVNGDLFFNRVELKMNQQLEESNHIDIRTLISILLMFNQELYPIPENRVTDIKGAPTQMYGNPEAALNKYLELGDKDSGERNKSIKKMSPILKDIVLLWDTIEREFPLIHEKKYGRLPFSHRLKQPKSMFSNVAMEYTVPKSVLYPLVAGFRVLVDIDENGNYRWVESPFEIWEKVKGSMFSTFLDSMKSTRNNPNAMVKRAPYWHQYNQIVLLCFLKIE